MIPVRRSKLMLLHAQGVVGEGEWNPLDKELGRQPLYCTRTGAVMMQYY